MLSVLILIKVMFITILFSALQITSSTKNIMIVNGAIITSGILVMIYAKNTIYPSSLIEKNTENLIKNGCPTRTLLLIFHPYEKTSILP